MSTTRRSFVKVGAGGLIASILGFDLRPVYAQARTLKIARTTETRSTCPYCSVSCGVIIHTLGDRAEECNAPGDPRGRRSGPPNQSRHSLSEGFVALSRYPQRAAVDETASPKARIRSLGRHLLGPGDRRNRAQCKEDSRRHLYRKGHRRQNREPLRGYRVERRMHRHK